MKQKLSFTFLFFILAYQVIFSPGCGQSIPPTGGPRDTLPPVLIVANPVDSTLHFKGNRITLQFNEYIQLDNPFEKVIVSPLPATNPQIQSKLRTVTIRLKDSLEPNTTYSINFGEAIRDINENNPLRNFTYIFSTGDSIDDNRLGGKVLVAQTGKVDSTLIVILHRNLEDSAVANQRPRYFARLNNEGFFNFHHLAPGLYNVFALKDADGGKKYDQKSELLGFLDSAVNIGTNTPPVKLYASAELPDEKRPLTGTRGSGTKPENQKDKRFRYTVDLENSMQDILSDLVISFERPIKNYDTSRLQFTDEQYNPISAFTISADTSHQKIALHHAWKENTKYNLVIQKDFATDSMDNAVTRTDTLSFTTKKESDYGSLRIRFMNHDSSAHPILLLFRNDIAYLDEAITGREINYRLFRPGEYELRVLYDRNMNGKWDTGNYWLKVQPEIVVARPQKLTIRPNFDNELEINLQELNN